MANLRVILQFPFVITPVNFTKPQFVAGSATTAPQQLGTWYTVSKAPPSKMMNQKLMPWLCNQWFHHKLIYTPLTISSLLLLQSIAQCIEGMHRQWS
jgi:hypothetical protein